MWNRSLKQFTWPSCPFTNYPEKNAPLESCAPTSASEVLTLEPVALALPALRIPGRSSNASQPWHPLFGAVPLPSVPGRHCALWESNESQSNLIPGTDHWSATRIWGGQCCQCEQWLEWCFLRNQNTWNCIVFNQCQVKPVVGYYTCLWRPWHNCWLLHQLVDLPELVCLYLLTPFRFGLARSIHFWQIIHFSKACSNLAGQTSRTNWEHQMRRRFTRYFFVRMISLWERNFGDLIWSAFCILEVSSLLCREYLESEICWRRSDHRFFYPISFFLWSQVSNFYGLVS